MSQRVLLLSTSDVKREALVKSKLFADEPVCVEVPVSVEQPVEPYGMVCAKLRLQNATFDATQYSHVISIESAVDAERCEDVVHVLVLHTATGAIYAATSLDGICFDREWMSRLGERTNVLGYNTAIGTASGLDDPKNWMKTYQGVDRVDQIMAVLYDAVVRKYVSLPAIVNYHPNFPKVGVFFKDISPLYAQYVREEFLLQCISAINDMPTHVVGIELRGVDLGAFLAQACGATFCKVRKAGKLPPPVLQQAYGTEYSRDTLEIQPGGFAGARRILIVDDLVATGGSMVAAHTLVAAACGAGTAPAIECFAPAYVPELWDAAQAVFAAAGVVCTTLKL